MVKKYEKIKVDSKKNENLQESESLFKYIHNN